MCICSAFAQEDPKKHTVVKDETLWSISQAYGITVSQLELANPQIENRIIVIGQDLIIPDSHSKRSKAKTALPQNNETETKNPKLEDKKNSSAPLNSPGKASNASVKEDKKQSAAEKTEGDIIKSVSTISESSKATVSNNDSETYTVQSGDTKYSLSNKFHLTITQLEKLNPHIVKMLIAGQEIKTGITKTEKSSIPPSKVAVTDPVENKKSETSTPANVVAEKKTITPPSSVIENVLKEKPSDNKDHNIKEEEKTTVPEEVIVAQPNPASKKETISKKQEIKPELTKKEPKPRKSNTKITETAPKSDLKEKTQILPETKIVKEVTAKSQAISKPEPNTTKEISIPTVEQEEIPSATTYVDYTIQPKETLYGLLMKSGMATSEFYKINPKLQDGVQAGMVIKMPLASLNSVANNTSGQAISGTTKYSNLLTTVDVSKSENVLFFLPFTQTEYESYKATDGNFNSVSDIFKKAHLEFYKGANIAIDSIRKLNIPLEVSIIEAQNAFNRRSIPANITEYDAIILPYYGALETDVARLTTNNDIPVISAAAIPYDNASNNLYSVLPSTQQQRQKVLDYMMSKNGNIVVINDYNRPDSKKFIEEYSRNVKFLELKRNGSISAEQLVSLLVPGRRNYVVIDSERNSVFLSTTNILLSQLSNFDLQLAVLEAALIPNYDDVSQNRYRILNMLFPSLTPAEITEVTDKFNADYNKKYYSVSTTHIRLGFDITFDTLLRLAQQQSFQKSATNRVTEYTQLRIDYKKKAEGGFINDSIYILQYDTESDIKEAR